MALNNQREVNNLMKKAILAGLVAIAFHLSAGAITFEKEQDSVEFRKAQMHLIGVYFKEMGNMIKARRPYDAAYFSASADRLAALSGWAHEGFLKRQLTSDSKAKPAIWEKKMDFDYKMERFHNHALKLQQVAAAKKNNNTDSAKSDLKELTAEFKLTGDDCTSCHDSYKSK